MSVGAEIPVAVHDRPVGRQRRAGAGRLASFVAVGLSGIVVNQLVLWFVTSRLGVHYLASALIATQCSTVWNFAFAELWVFRGGASGRFRRLLWFAALNNAWLLLRAPVLFVLTDVVGLNYLVSNLFALGGSTIARFVVADSRIWPATPATIETFEDGTVPGFAYDIHGIVRIRSAARLPELERFRVATLDAAADLVVEISGKGFGGLRMNAVVDRHDDGFTYVEHLGWLGFAARVQLGPTVEVQASPLLKASPHVLYTNIVEPVLRWQLVRKGYILAHAACLEIDGHGVMITARTDTGKTTTCLRAINDQDAGFVSDDMVILSRDARALSFPKPLTISAHTLKAARSAPLTLGRRAWLQVQSRLHSKGGRQVGLSLSRRNLPVCSLNAIVQFFVPPPKFHVEEIIPHVRTVTAIDIEHLVLIERGDALHESLDLDAACEILSQTTEDAYGFPPYPLIADTLANGEAALERGIRRQALARLHATRLRTVDRSWFERLPEVMGNPRSVTRST